MGSSLPRQPKKEKIGESPWAVTRTAVKKDWIENCCLGWPSTCLGRQISTDKMRNVPASGARPSFSISQSRAQMQWRPCLPSKLCFFHDGSGYKAALAHSNHPPRNSCMAGGLPSFVSTFKSLQLQNDPSSPPLDTVGASCPIGVPTRDKVRFIPWECMLKGAREDQAHRTWKLVLIITVKENNKLV